MLNSVSLKNFIDQLYFLVNLRSFALADVQLQTDFSSVALFSQSSGGFLDDLHYFAQIALNYRAHGVGFVGQS